MVLNGDESWLDGLRVQESDQETENELEEFVGKHALEFSSFFVGVVVDDVLEEDNVDCMHYNILHNIKYHKYTCR